MWFLCKLTLLTIFPKGINVFIICCVHFFMNVDFTTSFILYHISHSASNSKYHLLLLRDACVKLLIRDGYVVS